MDAPVVAAAVAEMARGEDPPVDPPRARPRPPGPSPRPRDVRTTRARGRRGHADRDPATVPVSWVFAGVLLGLALAGASNLVPDPAATQRPHPAAHPAGPTGPSPGTTSHPRPRPRPRPRRSHPSDSAVSPPAPGRRDTPSPPRRRRRRSTRRTSRATRRRADAVAWTFATRAVSCAVLAAAAARLVHPMRVHVSPHAARIFVALVVVALIGLVHVAVVAHRVDAVATRESPETHFEIRADSRRVASWGCEETAAWLDAEVGAWAAERAVETFCDLGVFAAELMEADDAMLRVELGVASRSRRRAVSAAAEKLRRGRDENGEERAKVWIATRGRDERGKEKEEGSKEGSKEGFGRPGSEGVGGFGRPGSEGFGGFGGFGALSHRPGALLSAPEPSLSAPEPSFTAPEPSLSARDPSLSAQAEPPSLPSSESALLPVLPVVSLSAWRASSPASRSADILGVTNCPRLRVLRDALLGDGALLDLAGLTRPPTRSNQTRPRVNPRAFALWMVWPGACAALRAHELWGLDAPAGAWGVAMGFALVAMWCQGAIELALRWRDGGGVGDARDPRSAAYLAAHRCAYPGVARALVLELVGVAFRVAPAWVTTALTVVGGVGLPVSRVAYRCWYVARREDAGRNSGRTSNAPSKREAREAASRATGKRRTPARTTTTTATTTASRRTNATSTSLARSNWSRGSAEDERWASASDESANERRTSAV